jgi:TolB-like protein/Tfp pilus assembly protein PilF
LLLLVFSCGSSRVRRGATTSSSVEATAESAGANSDDDESLLAIAVLPFESFTEDREDELFADGLADTLLHKLAQLETLTVIARNSSFQFKGQNVDVREIGEKLGVPTLLEGSVQRQGDQIRVIAQLVSTKDGAHWWSGTFDGTFENVFELQDEIAAAITEQLQITLTDQDRERLYRKGTSNPEAYETLARARATPSDSNSVDFDPDNNPRLLLMRKAVELDSGYALAWVDLSSYYSGLAFFDTDASRFDEFVAESRAAALKAIEVDPNESDGYAVLGYSHWCLQELPEGEEAYRKALALNPNNSGALSGLGLTQGMRNPDEAYRLFKRSQEIDPNSLIVYRQLYFMLTALGRADEGLAQLERGIRQGPGFFLLYSDLADLYSEQKDLYDLAAKTMSGFLQRNPRSREGLNKMAEYWYAVNDVARAAAWNKKLLEESPSDSDAKEMHISLLQVHGDLESAMSVANSLSQQGFSRIGRDRRILMLCMAQGDRECAVKHLASMIQFLNAIEQRSGQALPGVAAIFDFYSGWLQYPNEDAARMSLQQANEQLAQLALLSSGGFDVDSHRYFLAEIAAVQGNLEKAVAALQRTLDVADGGFVKLASGDLYPENHPILNGLREQPGYDEWLAEFTARRTAMREKMIALEAAGEIVRAP